MKIILWVMLLIFLTNIYIASLPFIQINISELRYYYHHYTYRETIEQTGYETYVSIVVGVFFLIVWLICLLPHIQKTHIMGNNNWAAPFTVSAINILVFYLLSHHVRTSSPGRNYYSVGFYLTAILVIAQPAIILTYWLNCKGRSDK